MLVHQIMKSKATDRVVTIRPEERVSAAVDVLRESGLVRLWSRQMTPPQNPVRA